MNDIISRRSAIKAIEDLQDCYNGYSDTYDKACIIGVLEEVPTVEAVPVRHGKWLKAYGDHEAFGVRPFYRYCSKCNEATVFPYNYCPNCGARMDEE